jgi:hypothetical protein
MAHLVKSKIVRWEGELAGVALEYSDGKHVAYSVGTWYESSQELERVRSGATNLPAKEDQPA